MTITALPTVPQRSDSSTFVTRREPFIEALGTFRTELNSTASVLNPLVGPSTTGAATAVQGASTAVPNSTLAVTSKDAAVASSNAALASANAAKASESSAKDSSVIATTAASDALIAANATANVVNKVSTIRPSTRPSLNLDFSNTETLDPRITFVRNSISSYIDYDGLLKYAPAGKPCFAYDPITGESLGLQIFESRTNLLTYSEQFDNAAWGKSHITLSANAATAPDGTNTAELITQDTVTWDHCVWEAISFTSGTVYTGSVYFKAGSAVKAAIWLQSSAFGMNKGIVVDLSTGAFAANVTAPDSYSITPLRNGWFRVSVTATASSTTSASLVIGIANSSNQISYTGDGTSGIYVWGAQLEAGSFPTPYIPTTSSTTTRAADQVSISGTNFSSWYNQGEGTFLSNFRSFGSTSRTNDASVFCVSNQTSNFAPAISIVVNNQGMNRIAAEVYDSLGVGQLSGVYGSVNSYTFGTNASIAFSYQNNNARLSHNGSFAGINDTSVFIPNTLDRLHIGNYYALGNRVLNGYIKKLSYYPKRLSPTELIGLTA